MCIIKQLPCCLFAISEWFFLGKNAVYFYFNLLCCVIISVFIVSTHLSIIFQQSLSVAIGLGENNAQRNLFFIQVLLSVLTRFGIKMDAKIQKSRETKKEALKDVSCIYLLLFCFTCVYVYAAIVFLKS